MQDSTARASSAATEPPCRVSDDHGLRATAAGTKVSPSGVKRADAMPACYGWAIP
jgi:hypothetical protein